MLDIEKNKELFLKKYQYYNQRINTVEYPKEELEKNTKSERDKYPNLKDVEILKKIRTNLLTQKYNHSLRVEQIVENLNKILENNKEFESVSNIAGLLHDYGRFMQAVLFNNYKDAEDFFKEHGLSGHGEVGSRILFINDEIKDFEINKKYYDILNKVIEMHSLPDLGKFNLKIDEKFKTQKMLLDKDLTISCMLQMVKDADMCDILYQRITGEYPLLTSTFKYHTNNKTLEEIPKTIRLPFDKVDTKLLEVPAEIKQKFFNKVYITNNREWDLRKMQNNPSYNYNSITAMWWSIGQFLGNMNFTASLKVIKEKNILEQIYMMYPEKYKYLVSEMFEFASEELLDKKIKENKIYTK